MDDFEISNKLADIERRLDSIESPGAQDWNSPQHQIEDLKRQIEDLKLKIEELERKSTGF